MKKLVLFCTLATFGTTFVSDLSASSFGIPQGTVARKLAQFGGGSTTAAKQTAPKPEVKTATVAPTSSSESESFAARLARFNTQPATPPTAIAAARSTLNSDMMIADETKRIDFVLGIRAKMNAKFSISTNEAYKALVNAFQTWEEKLKGALSERDEVFFSMSSFVSFIKKKRGEELRNLLKDSPKGIWLNLAFAWYDYTSYKENVPHNPFHMRYINDSNICDPSAKTSDEVIDKQIEIQKDAILNPNSNYYKTTKIRAELERFKPIFGEAEYVKWRTRIDEMERAAKEHVAEYDYWY